MGASLLKYKKELTLVVVSLLGSFLGYAFDFNYVILKGDFTMRFSDADDYMMMTRLRDFFVHGDLAYSLVHRVNIPFGVDIYWSRLYDFLLIVPIWFVDLFVHSIVKSIEYVCFFSSPIIKCILCLIVHGFFKKILKVGAFWGALMFAISPDLDEITQFGRPDHHIFILGLEILYLYTLANIAKNSLVNKFDYVKSGVVAVLCIWAAIETLPLILISEVVFFFFSNNQIDKLKLLYAKAMTTACGIGAVVLFTPPLKPDHIILWCLLGVMTMTAVRQFNRWHILLLISLLIVSRNGPISLYDKISTMHLALYLCASLYFAINAFYLQYTARGSIKFSLVTGLILGAAFLYKYPRFLLGVEGGACDFLRKIWFPNIQDLSSPLEHNYMDSICFCLFAVTLFVAIYSKICRLIRKKCEDMDVFWWLMVAINVVYCVFATMARRMLTNIAILSIPLFIDFALNGFIFKTFFSRKIKALVACLFILLPALWLKYIHMMKEFLVNTEEFLEYFKQKQLKIYEEDRIYKFLDEGLGPDPVVIMADPYSGPRILYNTRHNVVSVPFHSQKNGVISSLTITIKPQAGEKETKEILKSTNSSYVFVNKFMCSCPELSVNLANLIIHGHILPWLEPVQLPISNNNFMLVKVHKNKL